MRRCCILPTAIAFALAGMAGRSGTVEAQTWNGPYAGASAGYAGSSTRMQTVAECGDFVPFYFNCDNRDAVNQAGSGKGKGHTALGSLHAGYNWRSKLAVLGVEADFGSLGIRASRAARAEYIGVAAGAPFDHTSFVASDWLATFRLRAGVTLAPSMLVYATAGLALANVRAGHSFADYVDGAPATGSAKVRELAGGLAFGGGVEVGLARAWTLRAEYLRVDLGKITTASVVFAQAEPGAASSYLTQMSLTSDLVRVGLSYAF